MKRKENKKNPQNNTNLTDGHEAPELQGVRGWDTSLSLQFYPQTQTISSPH